MIRLIDLLLAKISLDTPANLLESVFRRSSSCAVSSALASSDVYQEKTGVNSALPHKIKNSQEKQLTFG